MAVSHVKSNTIGDWTGTVTVGNSAGGTVTAAATDLVRPGDWNSAHNQFYTLTGATLVQSTASGTDVVLGASGGIQIAGSTGSIIFSRMIHSGYDPWPLAASVTGGNSNGGIHFAPLFLPMNFQFDRMVFPVNFTGATNSTG